MYDLKKYLLLILDTINGMRNIATRNFHLIISDFQLIFLPGWRNW